LPSQSALSPLFFDEIRFGSLATMMVKDLNSKCLSSQSALSPLLSAAWLKIAVSIAPAAAMRSSLTLWV